MNSDLLDDIEPFYVMEILEEAQKYEKKGIDISHLEIGEPTRKTNKLIKQYAKKAISTIMIDIHTVLASNLYERRLQRNIRKKWVLIFQKTK